MRIAVVGRGNVGGENAGMQEDLIGLIFAISQGGLGPFVYRMAPVDQL